VIGVIEVSLDAIRANARTLARYVAPAKIAFVVKGNAYGHGMVPVAKAIAPLADMLCVYDVDEALVLRKNGIASPIVILGPVPPKRLIEAAQNDLAVALWHPNSYLHHAANAAREAGKPMRLHVKVNTGLSRLGVEPEELRATLDACRDLSEHVVVEGIFSHLASAEELDSPYTTQQLQRFLDALKTAPEIPAIRHIAASAAGMLWPQTRLDLVRVGIALYGLWPSAQTREAMNGDAVVLEPALSYRSKLVAIRDVPSGTPVGYGSTYHTPRATRIGVVPLGYADGIPRALSNTGAFLVGGVRCPIAGRVAMSMTMLDLSHAPNARVGDTVTLIGGDGDETIGADDWALWANTINYEIVTRLPAEIPRMYREPGDSNER